MSQAIFEYSYIVKPQEIDVLNHVNNVVYLKWVQEAAIKHWTELTKNKKFDEYVWVVNRHEIDYFRPAFLNDQLTIKTWVGKTEGSTSIRHVEVYKENKLITKTLTTWRLLDAKNFKSVIIPEEVLKVLEVVNKS